MDLLSPEEARKNNEFIESKQINMGANQSSSANIHTTEISLLVLDAQDAADSHPFVEGSGGGFADLKKRITDSNADVLFLYNVRSADIIPDNYTRFHQNTDNLILCVKPSIRPRVSAGSYGTFIEIAGFSIISVNHHKQLNDLNADVVLGPFHAPLQLSNKYKEYAVTSPRSESTTYAYVLNNLECTVRGLPPFVPTRGHTGMRLTIQKGPSTRILVQSQANNRKMRIMSINVGGWKQIMRDDTTKARFTAILKEANPDVLAIQEDDVATRTAHIPTLLEESGYSQVQTCINNTVFVSKTQTVTTESWKVVIPEGACDTKTCVTLTVLRPQGSKKMIRMVNVNLCKAYYSARVEEIKYIVNVIRPDFLIGTFHSDDQTQSLWLQPTDRKWKAADVRDIMLWVHQYIHQYDYMPPKGFENINSTDDKGMLVDWIYTLSSMRPIIMDTGITDKFLSENINGHAGIWIDLRLDD